MSSHQQHWEHKERKWKKILTFLGIAATTEAIHWIMTRPVVQKRILGIFQETKDKIKQNTATDDNEELKENLKNVAVENTRLKLEIEKLKLDKIDNDKMLSRYLGQLRECEKSQKSPEWKD